MGFFMLTQSEADYLTSMKKVLNESVIVPKQGNKASYNATSRCGREKFLLDINRTGAIKLTRCSFQERYQSHDILVRLDLDKSKPHKNPDDTIIIDPISIYIKKVMGAPLCIYFLTWKAIISQTLIISY